MQTAIKMQQRLFEVVVAQKLWGCKFKFEDFNGNKYAAALSVAIPSSYPAQEPEPCKESQVITFATLMTETAAKETYFASFTYFITTNLASSMNSGVCREIRQYPWS